MQICPKPLASLRIPSGETIKKYPAEERLTTNHRYVCRSASAGSRHSLLLMIDTTPRPKDQKNLKEKPPKRKTKVMTMGLNQVGLCEEKGYELPIDVNIPTDYEEDRPMQVIAGRGTSFVVSEQGALYSWGHGNFGVLGHENVETIQSPKRVAALLRTVIIKVSLGNAHTVALSDSDEIFCWGRNHKGQLGLGFESSLVEKISQVSFRNLAKYKITDIACGHSHSMALISVNNKYGEIEKTVYAWGDESRGQLGSGDKVFRMRPQENRWLLKYVTNLKVEIDSIYAGGFHNLVLLKGIGQVISWGANEYGQLGSGYQWDDPQPKIINNLKGVIYLAAGLRHNVAVCDSNSIEVFTWGYNGSGELGLGDTDIRLQPTHVTAIKNTKVFGVSCGDRHTIVITSPKPITAKEDTVLKPYFKLLEVCSLFIII
jgi:alpha-tubulin suppressor-like RCC1 family protein